MLAQPVLHMVNSRLTARAPARQRPAQPRHLKLRRRAPAAAAAHEPVRAPSAAAINGVSVSLAEQAVDLAFDKPPIKAALRSVQQYKMPRPERALMLRAWYRKPSWGAAGRAGARRGRSQACSSPWAPHTRSATRTTAPRGPRWSTWAAPTWCSQASAPGRAPACLLGCQASSAWRWRAQLMSCAPPCPACCRCACPSVRHARPAA